jgi:hypothetical protein
MPLNIVLYSGYEIVSQNGKARSPQGEIYADSRSSLLLRLYNTPTRQIRCSYAAPELAAPALTVYHPLIVKYFTFHSKRLFLVAN